MTNGMGWPEAVVWIAILASMTILGRGMIRYLDGPTEEQRRRTARKQRKLDGKELE